MTAVVTENGVYPVVRRNGTSGDEIILNEFRYLGVFIKDKRWLEQARKVGRRRIVIKMNPNDPNKIWYQDPDFGLQTFTLASKDPLLGRLATVEDLISTKTDEIGSVAKANDEADQARAKMKLQNSAERKQSKKEQKELKLLAKKANINSASGADRRKNLQDEVAATGQSPMPIQHGTEVKYESHVESSENLVKGQGGEIQDDLSKLMNDWLQEGKA